MPSRRAPQTGNHPSAAPLLFQELYLTLLPSFNRSSILSKSFFLPSTFHLVMQRAGKQRKTFSAKEHLVHQEANYEVQQICGDTGCRWSVVPAAAGRRAGRSVKIRQFQRPDGLQDEL